METKDDNTQHIIYSAYNYVHPLIRCRRAYYDDPFSNEMVTDFEVEVFRRPWFGGWLGAKKWQFVIATNSHKDSVEFANHYMQRELKKYNEKNPPVDIFEPKYMKLIGFTVTKDDGQYGKAESIFPKGKRVLSWNRDGELTWFGIREDADTRNAFNGTVENREQLELLLRLAK